MTDLVKVALIAGVSSSLPSLMAQVIGIFKIHGLAKSVNGMKEEQIITAMREGKALGAKQEHDNPT